MSKELNLPISERLACIRLFDEFKGNVSGLAGLIDDIKLVSVKPEEWEAAKLVKTPIAPEQGGGENLQWKDEGSEKVISLSEETVAYLKSKIKEKSDANELTLQDAPMISLNSKLQ